MDLDEPDVKRTLHTASSAAGRCGFLAGFAYYEIGRWGFYGRRNHVGTVYLAFLVGVFTLSVMSAALAAYVKFYASSLSGVHRKVKPSLRHKLLSRLTGRKPPKRPGRPGNAVEMKDYVEGSFPGFQPGNSDRFSASVNGEDTLHPAAEFVRKATGMIRNCFRMFNYAVALHFLGVAMTGWVYYPTSPARWIPFIAGLSGLAYNFFAILKVVKSFVAIDGGGKNLSLEEYYKRVDEHRASGDLERAGSDTSMASSESGTASDTGSETEPMAQDTAIPRTESGKRYLNHPFMQAESTLLADRAVFLAAFACASNTRYLGSTGMAAHAFVACSALACVMSITCMMQFTQIDVFLFDLEGDDRKERFATAMMKPFRAYKALFLLALVFMIAVTALVGWGGSYLHHKWFTTFIGCGGAVLLAYTLVVCHRAITAGRNPALSQHMTCKTSRRVANTLMAQVSSTGSQATIFAGFVWYNVVTFRTDVENLNMPMDWSDAFMIDNTVTFVLGLVVVFMSTTISMSMNSLRTCGSKAYFAIATHHLGRICFGLYHVALLGFVIGFGLYGYAKFNPMKPQPAVCAAVCFVMMVFCFAWIWRAYFKAKNGADLPCKEACMDPSSIPNYWVVSQVETVAGRALFSAGFAFFAVNFFFKPKASEADVYLILMGTSFVSGFMVVTINTIIQIPLRDLHDNGHIAKFISSVKWLCFSCYWLYMLSLLSFFGGLCIIGYVKKYYALPLGGEKYAYPMLIGGSMAITLSLFLTAWVWRAYHIAKSKSTMVMDVISESFDLTRLMRESEATTTQAIFVAGNVFYEILFSDRGKIEWANYFYFSTTTLTLVLGAVIVLLDTSMTFAAFRLTTKRQRSRFGRLLNPSGLMFLLYNTSQFTWLLSLMDMGYVKYHSRWPVTFIWGAIGFTVVLFAWLRLRSIWKPISLRLRSGIRTDSNGNGGRDASWDGSGGNGGGKQGPDSLAAPLLGGNDHFGDALAMYEEQDAILDESLTLSPEGDVEVTRS